MARPKRNAGVADLDSTTTGTQPAKKGRSTSDKQVVQTAAASRPKRASAGADEAAKASATKKSASKGSKGSFGSKREANGKAAESAKNAKSTKAAKPVKSAEPAKSVKSAKSTRISKTAGKGSKASGTETNGRRSSIVSVEIAKQKKEETEDEQDQDKENEDDHSYWLMKAEPESRIEKGRDVKFSIDDLKAATQPEGWDGVRNLAARNNMRAMSKGDQAFFYHSNCKTPGIAGVMEIVQESSVDESAFNPEHPYFDPKSDRDSPKWSLVHVEFRHKFPNLVKLKELQKYAEKGGVLENLQTLKQSRLSVSKVSKKEWNFILGLVDEEEAVE